MPELPEVETLCRQLRQVVLGRPILSLEIFDRKLGPGINPAGRRVTDIRRVGKGIDITLTGGLALKIHLRMSGRLYWQEQYHIILPHTRFVMTFPHGIISCVDPRRFATLSLVTVDLKSTLVDDSLLGFNPIKLWNAAKRRRLPIKSFLMDQRIIGGVGNIYACEILHEATIDPQRGADTLSPAEWRRLGKFTLNVLRRAIACRGTTLSDWRDLFGRKGEYQACLKVYGHEDQACPRCGSNIRRETLQGRGTYFCPSCQR
ncbi:MAG: bifunctional DNA-formamidopyrimidine glycosylase/DNA-(apurinic or apyrimidinic site) lyase [Syntrophales bacterium]|jgi:formamidopyrimidine-DNA glycosylase